ncbi:uncharacterized protein LOC128553027 [Mercenaria mercenaria]|uniref:uncharacterized protein LOC128553027 n=1 Tax=Mercenaria mercenaria TaxID=6596 RepID=UPI00234F5DF2|nr:uncharacterized protein LOC128553027 [Mercenaria mercenaria]
MYPAVGSVDIQKWDVTLLAVLLTQLFSNQLEQKERDCLRDITDIRNSLQHIANTDTIDDQQFNTAWSGLRDAVLTLSKCTGAPSLNNIEDEIKSALTEGMPNLVDVIRTWNQVVCMQLKLHNFELANEIKTIKEVSRKSSKILTKASVKRKGRSGMAEKRMKIVVNRVERMKEKLAKALTEENDCIESFKNDIALITQQLIENHRVIVTGHDNMLTYKCALAAVNQRNYQRTDQCLEINNPSDWKRISPEDAQFVLFREPFGRSTYDSQKVETMLEEFDSMLDATNDDNDEVIDIIIVTNQRLLNEVARQNEHDMLSPASTVYIDTTSGNTPEEAGATEDTVYRNLLEYSKIYRHNYTSKTVEKQVKAEAEKMFIDYSTIAIVGSAGSGKTSLSFQLLQAYDLSNGEENFLVIINPEELIYVKFSLRPVIILKLLTGMDFDKVEACKWYRQFDRLFAAVQEKKVAVIITMETEVFRMWEAHMPTHPLIDRIVYMAGTRAKGRGEHEPGTAEKRMKIVDNKVERIKEEAGATEDTVYRNLLEYSKIYRHSYTSKTVEEQVKAEAEKKFIDYSTVAIVGSAGSGKTSLSFQLLPTHDLSNGEENFLVIINPEELKYVKFSLRPVIILKLLAGMDFDKVEACKWYRQFDRLFTAVQEKKVAVIITMKTEVFRMWEAHMPTHPLLDHVVYIADPGAKEKEKHEPGKSTLPSGLLLDPLTQKLYEDAIKHGKEIDNSIRIMVIGCYGQGKTSLVNRLLGKTNDNVETTNGIEVHACHASNNEWEVKHTVNAESESFRRLAKIAKNENHVKPMSHELLSDLDVDNVENIDCKADIQRKGKTEISYDVSVNRDKLPKFVQKSKKEPLPKRSELEPTHLIPMKNETKTKKSVYIDKSNVLKFQKEYQKSLLPTSSQNDRESKDLSIWDFGGQFVYYATHQIFLSQRAVYLLVFNLTGGLDKKVTDRESPCNSKTRTMRDYIRFWVGSVHSFVGSEDGNDPPIILVGTHNDQIDDKTDTFELFEDVRKIFDGSVSINHIHKDHFAISNVDKSDINFDMLRTSILEIGKCQAKTEIPAKWIPLEKALVKNRDKKIVTFEDLIMIDSQNEYPIQTENKKETEDQFKLFLMSCHAKGTFCYFDDNELSEYVVLDPTFLIDAFKALITAKQFCKVRPPLRSLWHKLFDTGILMPELVHEVWRDSQNKDFTKFEELLLRFLQRHHIISEVLRYDDDVNVPTRVGKYIVPSFLKVPLDEALLNAFLEGKNVTKGSLIYQFEDETIVPLLYQRTLAALIGKWPLSKYNNSDLVYANVVACEPQTDHAVILKTTNNDIELLVVNLCPSSIVKPDVCDLFRRFVEMVIKHEITKLRTSKDHGISIKNIEYMHVKCYHTVHGSKGSLSSHKVEYLKNESTANIPCPDKESHHFDHNAILNEWFQNEIKLKDIERRRLTEKEYSHLSMHIDKNWEQLAYQLDFSTVEVQQITMDIDTPVNRVFEMFVRWDQKHGCEATLDVLVRAVKRCHSCIGIHLDILKNIIDF